MRKKLTQKLSTILLSLAMLFSCLFVLVSCGKNDGVASLSIELVSDEYVLKDGKISVTYGKKVELDASDFKVLAVYKDDSTKEIELNSDAVQGFTFASTLPSDEKTPAGEYTLTFTYDDVSAEVKVKVEKAVIQVSDVRWNYNPEEPYVYNKAEQKVELVGLPDGVTATYQNNTATNHGEYVASAVLSYADSNNYVVAPVADLAWKINKADIDMSNVGTTTNLTYSGTLKSSVLYNVPEGVAASLADGTNMAIDAGTYEVEYSFEYRGDDAENYNPIPNKSFTYTIKKANFSAAFVQVDTFKYKGEAQTILEENIHLPSGVKLVSIEGTQTLETVGKASLTLTLEFEEAGLKNFNEVETVVVEWGIDKADFNMSGVSWNYSGSYVYDGTEKSVSIAGELPDGLSVKSYANNAATNAGTYIASVVFEYEDELFNAPNFANCNWTINKKTLTIKANDNTIVYSDIASEKGVSYSGFISGESAESVSPISGELVYRYGSYFDGADVGEYTISLASSTLIYQNYAVSYQNGKLTVVQKEIDMTGTTWDYTAAYTYSGVAQKPMLDNVSEFVGVIYKYKVKDTDVEINPIAAGTYVATAEFKTSSNYKLINNNATQCEFVIQKAVVTVTANPHTINFGEAAANAGVSYSGFMAGEYATNIELSGNIVYAYGAYAAGADVGEYEINISTSTLSADNYNFNYISGKLTVVPIEIDMSRVNWNYTAPYTYSGLAQKPILSNIPTGVKVTYAYKLAGENAEPVGAGTYSAIATFETSKNYTLVNNAINEREFVIQKAVLTVTANPHTITFFDDIPTECAGVVYSGFVNGETSDSVEFDGEIKYTFANYTKGTDVGDYENEVLISTSTLSANNYTFEYVAGKLIVELAMVDLSSFTWNYDEANPYIYDGEVHKPIIEGIPEFVECEYIYTLDEVPVEQPIEVGVYQVMVIIPEPDYDNIDNVNYFILNPPAEEEIEFRIVAGEVSE